MADADELYAKAKSADALEMLALVAAILIRRARHFRASKRSPKRRALWSFIYLFIGAVAVPFVTPSVYGFIANFMQNRRKLQTKKLKISSLASFPPS